MISIGNRRPRFFTTPTAAVCGGQQSKTLGNHRKLRERANLKLLRHLVPMQFHRSFRHTQRVGNLLVRLAPHQQIEDIPLTGRKLGKMRA
jgi:hypothetical protein